MGRAVLLACIAPWLLASCDKGNYTAKTTLICNNAAKYRYCTRNDGCVSYSDNARKPITHLIDSSRRTVDGMPAKITDATATWEWEHQDQRYQVSIDRFTRTKTMKVGTADAWSELEARCDVMQRAF
jgi:hypothetical protein